MSRRTPFPTVAEYVTPAAAVDRADGHGSPRGRHDRRGWGVDASRSRTGSTPARSWNGSSRSSKRSASAATCPSRSTPRLPRSPRPPLDAGAHAINDVSAGREDEAMLPLAARRDCGLVLMHRLLPPEQDNYSTSYQDAAGLRRRGGRAGTWPSSRRGCSCSS